MAAETETGAELTTAEAAMLAGVSERTVRNWIKDGKLPVQTTEGGKRIRRSDVLALLHERVQAVAGALPVVELETVTTNAATVAEEAVTVAETPAEALAIPVETTPEPLALLMEKLSIALEQLAGDRVQLQRLHQENIELAGRCGFLQAKLQETEQKLLTATVPAAEEETVAETPRVPWWKRLFV